MTVMSAGRQSAVPGTAAISAHRGGAEVAPGGTYAAYQHALETGAEYVEFDVRQTLDGRLVSYHGGRTRWGTGVGSVSYARLCDLAGYEVPLVTEIMSLLAGRAVGHLDLKPTGNETMIIQHAYEILGAGGFLVTTGDLAAAVMIRRTFPGVPVAVTVGGDLTEAVRFRLRRARNPALSPLDRILAGEADWAALHHRSARRGALEQCRQRGLKTMVWTVNDDGALARWLAHPCVDIVVTDRPAHAVKLRSR
jgi:glycerophosphoryl diester phosphodiesterase